MARLKYTRISIASSFSPAITAACEEGPSWIRFGTIGLSGGATRILR